MEPDGYGDSFIVSERDAVADPVADSNCLSNGFAHRYRESDPVNNFVA